jgi:hypothetical protein
MYVAGLGWTVELIVPFLNIPHKAPIWIIILVVAESSFLIGLAVLGKPAYHRLKASLLARTAKRPD